MQTTTLSFANMHNHGDLFANMFRARRRADPLDSQWDLTETIGLEYDQYDTPASRWIAVHELGEILAGLRLTPTTARCGAYSYLIRDAQQGLLDGLPQDILFRAAPVDPTVWEASRVFMAPAVTGAARAKLSTLLFDEMTRAARELGATRVLGLFSADWLPLAVTQGLGAAPAGRRMMLDGAEMQCMTIDLTAKMH